MSDKPMVSLPHGRVDWAETTRETYDLLAKTGEFFYHRGEAVRVFQEPGQPAVIKPLKAAEAVSTFEHRMRFFIGDKVKPLKKEEASILLAADAKSQLPFLKGISQSPVLREVDGRLLPTPRGYDPVTQVFYQGDPPPEVPFQVAANCIMEVLLGDFEFETRADLARALANLLLPSLKRSGLIQGRVPVTVIEANQSGTGKGYLDDLRAACHGDQVKLVTGARGGVGSPDEAFAQSLGNGNPFPQLDNLRGSYDSVLLEQFATGDGPFEVRLVRIGYRCVDREKFFVSVTSNGFDTTQDFASRCMFVRLRYRGGGAFRHYPEGDLLAHVRTNQPYFLGCIFAVLREWFTCGQHRTCEGRIRNGFHDGIQVADWIVQSLFGLPPIMDGHLEIQRRIASKNLGWLRRLCNEVRQADRLGEEMRASGLGAVVINAGLDVPGVPSTAMDNDERVYKAIGAVMGDVFRGSVGDRVLLEGFTVTRTLRRDPGELPTSGTNETKFYCIEENRAVEPANGGQRRLLALGEGDFANTQHPLPADRN